MKKMKNALLLSIIISLVTTTLVNLSPVYANPTFVAVDPSSLISSDLTPPDTFDIDINVTDVPTLYGGLFGYEFKLRYWTAVLDVIGVTIGPFLQPTFEVWKNEINETAGYVWLAISQATGESPVSGSGILATITFEVKMLGGTPLDLCDTKLAGWNSTGNAPWSIDHDAYDGEFSNVGRRPKADFYWEPLSPEMDLPVVFYATGSYALDGKYIASWDWDFGDGTVGSGEIVEHIYDAVGIYTVTLTVTDNLSAQDKLSATIWIAPPNVALADLAEWKARPEKRTYDQSMELTKGRDLINALYAEVQSFGGRTVVVKVRFTATHAITFDEIIIETSPVWLTEYLEIAIFDTSTDPMYLPEFDTTIHPIGKYYVKAQCLYLDADAYAEDPYQPFEIGAHAKTFSFKVKP